MIKLHQSTSQLKVTVDTFVPNFPPKSSNVSPNDWLYLKSKHFEFNWCHKSQTNSDKELSKSAPIITQSITMITLAEH